MRVVCIAASTFGLECLRSVQALPSCEVVGVVTAPQTFSISYRPEGVTNVLYADMASYCEAEALPCAVMETNMKDSSLFEQVSAWAPDMFLVAGWYHMVPKQWRDLAPAYGLHASLLPDYSGGAPLVWAMIHGEKETGISLFQFDAGVDSGPIVDQARTPISDEDTIATLYSRIQCLALEMLRRTMPRLADGTAEHHVQDESKRRIMPQRSPEDGVIDWQQPASAIHNFVRAQTKPYPGAFTEVGKAPLHLWKTALISQVVNGKAGTLMLHEGAPAIICGDGQLLLVQECSYAGVDYHLNDNARMCTFWLEQGANEI